MLCGGTNTADQTIGSRCNGEVRSVVSSRQLPVGWDRFSNASDQAGFQPEDFSGRRPLESGVPASASGTSAGAGSEKRFADAAATDILPPDGGIPNVGCAQSRLLG